MPLWEYKCDEGHVTEKLMRGRPEQMILCPLCVEKNRHKKSLQMQPLLASLQISVPAKFQWGHGGYN